MAAFLALWLRLVALGSVYLTLAAENKRPASELSDLHQLCNPQESLNDRTLILSDTWYNVSDNTTCRVESVSNLTIRGNSSQSTVIGCSGSAIFSFFNVTSLSISNIHFVGCGDLMTEDDLNHLAESSYFNGSQAATLLCNHCFDLHVDTVSFSGSLGYSFVGISLLGDSILDGVQVLGTSENHSHYVHDESCRLDDSGYATGCKSKGVLLFFADPRSVFSVSSANVVLENCYFYSNDIEWTDTSPNKSRCTYTQGSFDDFLTPWEEEVPSALPIVGGLTIAQTQINGESVFPTNVSVRHSKFEDNHGLCFGAVFVLMHTWSVTTAQQHFENCTFLFNSPRIVPNNEGKNYFARDVTVFMKYRGQPGESRCLSITDSFFTSRNNEYRSPSLSVIHFPSTVG
jgi:hypothetical protein